MSNKTTKIMKEHLQIAEKYISDMNNAKSKKDFMNAMQTCETAVKAQYEDLEDIADDFCTKITNKSDKELSGISERIGEIFGQEITKLYVKMAPYMAEPDFMGALGSLDIVVGSNPLFGANEFGADIATEVSKTIAGTMDGMATKMMADSTPTDEKTIIAVTDLMNNFLQLSQRYVERMKAATTGRKIVTATNGFVDSVKKLIPEMKIQADHIRFIMAKNEKPEGIIKAADELKQTLGDDLKAVLKDKAELMQDQKVQKSVSKLGAILNEVPF